MHPFSLPANLVERVTHRAGRPHPFDVLDPRRTALVVVDMQNYFLAPGYLGETPVARAIVPGVNELAAGVRSRGGSVVWVKNATDGTEQSWSVLRDSLFTPAKRDLRHDTMRAVDPGHALWPELDVRPDDTQVVKTRFSAFIQGASGIEALLRARGADTVLIAGTATNVCCESSARDAMMLNFRTVMVHDALAAATDAEHAAALTNFYSIFGDVLSIAETLEAFDRHRGV